jgi:CubicO group peptidase (beta-lactamase class C family)
VRRVFVLFTITCAAAGLAAIQPPPGDPAPEDLGQFRAAAERILAESGVPGAAIALVRSDGVEWEGGVGYADRDRKSPVTEHTHFRVGSISKTFVALALVQLYEDGAIDLDAPVRDIAPEIEIDNPWEDAHPVRVIDLLQHTAGFDDMHFNEMYVAPGAQERSLEDVLTINPNSRRVRWVPGTRMAYANPGYAVAGRLIEKVTDQPYEDYIKREIFDPLDMTTSSFRLTGADEALLAQGYDGATGPPVGYPRIHLRPAGNMHSSAHEMAQFVRMLLGWGELGTSFVVDPEYLSNMEHPQVTLAAHAGLRHGYGSGISTRLDLPYEVLGHGGGISGFLSSYGYSPGRDVGYVVLLNSTGARAEPALQRLCSLSIRYLKRDVEPPRKPVVSLDSATMEKYVGYYMDGNPRNQFTWPLQRLLAGREIAVEGAELWMYRLTSVPARLVPVTESTFRLDQDLDASLVFTTDDDGRMVLAGASVYAEKTSRARADALRAAILVAVVSVGSVVPAAIAWIIRLKRARPRGFWDLKIAMLLCPVTILIAAISLRATTVTNWGSANAGTITVFVCTLAIPVLALIVAGLTLVAIHGRASRWLTTYAGLVALAMGGLSLYLSSHGILPLRTWAY